MREEIAKVAKRISWVQDDLLRKLYIQKASGLFGIRAGDITQEVIAQARKSRTRTLETVSPAPESIPIVEVIPEEEKSLLKVMIDSGASMIEYIMGRTAINEFQEGASRELASALVKIYQEYHDKSIKVIQEGHLDVGEQAQQLMASLMIDQHHVSPRWSDQKIKVPSLNEDIMQVAKQSMLVMKQKSISKYLRELERKILATEEGSEEQMKLQEEYAKKYENRVELQSTTYFV